jgi:hypothetical protein
MWIFKPLGTVQLAAGLFFLCVEFLVTAVSQQVVPRSTENDHPTSEVNDADFGARVPKTCWPDCYLSFRLHQRPRE